MNERAERPSSFPWPPVVLAVSFAAGVIAHVVYPLGWPRGVLADLLQGLGLFAIAIAVLLYFLSAREMRRKNTTVLPHAGADHLVTTGPFAVSRNPIYLANVLLLSGLGLAFGNAWMFAAAALCAIGEQKLAIDREEAHLELRFGKAWRDYKKRVRRWI